MSDWYYRKQGMLDETTEGPLSDAEFLRLAYDGKMKLDTLVTHQKNTNGQWVTVGQIPAARKKLDEGAEVRRQAKELAATEAAQKREEKRVAAAELKQQRLMTKEAERQAMAAEKMAKAEELQQQVEAERSPNTTLTTQQSRPPIPVQQVEGSAYQNAPVIAPTPTTAIQVNVQQPSHAAHSLGISSLVLGIFSFFVCWMPIIGFPLSGLGFLLGIVGLILAFARNGTGIGYSIAGTAVNGIGLLLGFIFITFIASTFQAVDQAMNELKKENVPVQAKPVHPTTPDARPSEDDTSVPTKVGDQPTAMPPAPTQPTEPTWAKAGTSLQLGDVQLRITEVVIGKVPLWREILDRDGVSEDDLLTIWLEVANTSERKKIDYQGWMSDYASLLDIDAKLTDDADNNYRRINFSATLKVKDAVTNESIYPGKSIRDAVVFELPIDGAEYLRLKLSAKGCKEKGEFRFEIPKEIIARR